MPRVIALLLLVVMTLSLTACGPGRDKSRKPSTDWSKGVALGYQVVGAVDMFVDGDGDGIHLVWPVNLGSTVRIQYMQLDSETNLVLDQNLEMETAWPRGPRLAEARGDRLHLLWAHRLGGETTWELWHGFIDTLTGELSEAKQISTEGTDVGLFSIANDGAEGVYAFWDSRDDHGIDAVHIGPSGEIVQGPMRIGADAASPSGVIDDSGNLHLVWFGGSYITYAMLPDGVLEPAEGMQITNVSLGTGDNIDGPTIGLSDGWIYLLWSKSSRSGLEPGTSVGWYVAFPDNEPRAMSATQTWLVPFEDQAYEEYQGAYNLTELADLAVPPYGSDYIENLAPLAGHPSTLIAAVAMDQAYRLDSYLQIAVLLFEGGEFFGYQVATKTTSISREPVIAANDAGGIYITWREGTSGNRLYFAATAPTTREVLDKTESYEIFRALITGGLESFAGFGFFPFAFFWLAPGLIILGLVEVFGRETDFNKPGPIVFLVLSILIYQLMKIIIVPTIFSYVPFSAWIEVPTALKMLLRVGVPLATMGIGLLIALWVSWRQDNRAVLIFFFVLAGVDALLTLMIYGVNFLGAF